MTDYTNSSIAELDIIFKSFDSTKWNDKKSLPKAIGTYLFIEKDLVIYVGSSINLSNRFQNHGTAKRIKNKEFKIYWCILKTITEARELENFYIQLFKPLLNETKKVVVSKKDLNKEKLLKKEVEFITAWESNQVDQWFQNNTWDKCVVAEMQKDPELLYQMYRVCKESCGG